MGRSNARLLDHRVHRLRDESHRRSGARVRGNWQAAALLVVAERTGKGIRGPARDVLLVGSDAARWPRLGFRIARRDGSGRRAHRSTDHGGVGRAVASLQFRRSSCSPFPALGALIALGARASSTHGARRAAKPLLRRRRCRTSSGCTSSRPASSRWDSSTSRCWPTTSRKRSSSSQPMIPLLFALAMGINGIVALGLGETVRPLRLDRARCRSRRVGGRAAARVSWRANGGGGGGSAVGRRHGGAGRDAPCRHLAGCVDEQAWQCVRRVQRVSMASCGLSAAW